MSKLKQLVDITNGISLAVQANTPIDNTPPAYVIRNIDLDKIKPIVPWQEDPNIKYKLLTRIAIEDGVFADSWFKYTGVKFTEQIDVVNEFIKSHNLYFHSDDEAYQFFCKSLYFAIDRRSMTLEDEDLANYYISEYIKDDIKFWYNEHLINFYDEDRLKGYIPTFLKKNLAELKEATDFIKEYKKTGKNLIYMEHSNRFVKKAANWHRVQNELEKERLKNDFINYVSNSSKKIKNQYTKIAEFLKSYYDKFESLANGRISTSVLSWLVSIGWGIVDVFSGGSVSLQLTLSLTESICSTISAVELKNTANDIWDKYEVINKALPYLEDLEPLFDVNNLQDLYEKSSKIKGLENLITSEIDNKIKKTELAADLVDFFTGIKEKIAFFIAKKHVQISKIIFKGTPFLKGILEAESIIGKGELVSKNLFKIRNLLNKNIGEAFSNSIRKLMEVLDVSKNTALLANLSSMANTIVSVVNISLDAAELNFREAFNEQIPEI
ncbi:hypothetical protein [Mycoplasma seminis]|uniref:Uncharacterized protein n=1 Tax=Mycoplasma seminis TaxID=512749 RepID=A0ABY9H9N6_9MOLU|nr:hypothetical protein [Mycoplasma seminis]WLP85300.1 hypothetical protein Q8852_03180 [Mycoplasma seminis]